MKLKLSNKYSLNIPDGYRKLKQTKPAEADDSLPKDILAYQKTTNNSDNLMMIFVTSEEDAMPYDEQQIIDGIHETLDDRQGVIEVCTVEKDSGERFVYSIVKTVKEPAGVLYYLRMNIFSPYGDIYELQATFEEIGTTGVRDSTIFAMARNENLVDRKSVV